MTEQGSAEWLAERLGRVTASRIADMLAQTKSGWGASRAAYKAQLVAERLTGAVAATFTNREMQWGTETEPQARAAYEFMRDATVEQVGFVQHPRIPMTGASPDGLVGTDGLLELKCPATQTHIDTLLGGSIPSRYVLQMQWQLACTGRVWCDFASFDPRMPGNMSLFVKRLARDDAEIARLEKETVAFLSEVDETVAALRDRYEREAA